MKKLITAIAIGAFTFAGTAIKAEAGHYGDRGYNVPSSTVYVSGYHHGRPIYTEKYFVGYDCYGRPRFAYRTVSAPVRHYDNRYYGNSRSYSSHGNSYNGGHCDDRRSSGASVSFSFGRR